MTLDVMLFARRIGVSQVRRTEFLLDRVQKARIRTVLLGDLVIDGCPVFDPGLDCYSETAFAPTEVAATARPRGALHHRRMLWARGLRMPSDRCIILLCGDSEYSLI